MHINLFSTIFTILHSVTHVHATHPAGRYPTRTIAGVSVIDTPLVRAAHDLARVHGDVYIYRHVMRSWLFGAIMIGHNETLRKTIDLEVHAVSVLLHDLGWDRTSNSPFVSPDRRFEVDGAIAARSFIRNHRDGARWEERRVQLVWDAIALHTEPRIAWFKEPDVAAVQKGVGMDFEGPGFGVTSEEYNTVVGEFPKQGFRNSLNQTMIWLCQTKPQSTYDNFIQPWGDRYVHGYRADGKEQVFDNIFFNLP